MQTIQIEILLGTIAFVLNSCFGVMVLSSRWKSWTNRLFFILSLIINAYIVVNYISLHPIPAGPESQLFWIQIVMFTCSFIGPTLVLLAHTFPHDTVTLKLRYRIGLLVLMLASAVASLSPLVFSGIEYPNGSPVPMPGPGIPIFFIDFVGLFIVSFIILLYKFYHAHGLDRQKLRLLLVGVLTSFSLMGLSTVTFVVILQTSAFVFLGPLVTVFLLTCIGYAIVRYQLFNLKVIAADLLTTVIAIALLGKIVVASSSSDRIIDAAIFGSVVIFGWLLVRSVRNEVKQREELQTLTTELAAANDQLTALDKARTEFISIASHQLRTPPATIKWYLAAVLAGDFGPLTSELQAAIERAKTTNDTQIATIDDLLNASRIERGKLEFYFEKGDLELLVKSLVEQLEPLAKMKKMKITYQPPANQFPQVLMDKEKIRQVINNFIDNAIKYSKDETEITVRAYQSDTDLIVRVTDHGKGISPAERDTLFQKYTRGQNAATHATGLGLGLYVAKVVVDQHEGKIWVESEGEGKGSSFAFSLPIKSDLKPTVVDLVKNNS